MTYIFVLGVFQSAQFVHLGLHLDLGEPIRLVEDKLVELDKSVEYYRIELYL